MCRLQNIAMCDYQESVTIGQTDRLRQVHRQTPDIVIPMCRYASQATQKQPNKAGGHCYTTTPIKFMARGFKGKCQLR